MKKIYCWATMAAIMLACVGVTKEASAQCGTYVITPSSGATIVPGTTDIGNHADDLTTPITLPFAFNFYGTSYAAANVSSNGNLQFGGADPSGANTCIGGGNANGLSGPTMYPHWDDLRTTGPGRGIFTGTYGTSPTRSFAIEWRAGYTVGPSGALANVEIILYEGQTYFDFIYGTVDQGPGQVTLGASATVGVKATNTAAAAVTQYSCNSAVLSNGLRLRFECPNTPPTCALSLSPTGGPAGSSFNAFCTVMLGTGPSSPIASARLDAGQIGGGTVSLHDDGLPPDAVAGDNIFSGQVTAAVATALGAYTLTSTVTDGLARSGNSSAIYTVTPVNDECAAALPAVLGNNAFDNLTATTSVPADPCSLMVNDLWWTYQPPADGMLTVSTCGLSNGETAVAIYADCLTPMACDADSCSTFYQSNLSVCVTGGHTYYLRVGGYDGSRWSGSFSVAFTAGIPALTATCAPVCGDPGTAVTLTARRGMAGCALQVPLTGVSVDCSQIGAGTVTLLDNGVPPDLTAGDGVFSGSAIVGPAVTGGFKQLTYTGSFGAAGTAGTTKSYRVPSPDEAGALRSSAAPAPSATSIVGLIAYPNAGCGNDGVDVDMYIIHMCDPANFSASTVNSGTTFDTKLFLFRMDGTGIVMNDNAPGGGSLKSRLSNAFTSALPPGDYLLAISAENNNPTNPLHGPPWLDFPHDIERAPDGPGAASPFDGWDANSASGGAYQIDLTGVCLGTVCCSADYNGDGDVGTDSDIAAFFACLGGNCCPTCPPNADFNCDGDVGTDADIASFFRVLGGGPC
jgi:hypothetical protein